MKARRSKLAPDPHSAAPAVGQPLRRSRFHSLGAFIIAAAAWEAAPTTLAADGFWLGNAGSWGDPAIWLGETPADGADSTAFFTGINLTANRTITLDTPRTIGNISFNDATTASNDLTISGTGTLTLNVATGAPLINVANQTLTIDCNIAGNDGLIKDGDGALVFSRLNSITGGLTIRNGTVNFPNSLTSLGSGTITLGGTGSSGASLISGVSSFNAFLINAPDNGMVSVGSNGVGSGPLFSGNFTLNGNLTFFTPVSAAGALRVGGSLSGTGNLTVNNAGSTSSITLGPNPINHTGNITVQGDANAAVTISGALGGNVTGITKASRGTLHLAGSNSYSGPTLIGNGTLSLGNINALAKTSGITLVGATTLACEVNEVSIPAPITLDNSAPNTATIIVPNNGMGGATRTLTLNGAIGGTGNLNLSANTTTGNSGVIVLNAASGYTGNTTLTTSGGILLTKLGVGNALPATTILTINGGNGSGSGRAVTLDLNGFNQTLAGLTSTTGLYKRQQRINNTSDTAAMLTVNNRSNATFTGEIGAAGTNLGLTKTGIGTLTLGGANTYTGPTIVNGGGLVLDFNLFATSLTGFPSDYIHPDSVLTLGGTAFTVSGRLNASAVASTGWTATAETNVAKITFTTLPTGIVVGQRVNGTGLRSDTFVVSIDPSSRSVILNSDVTATTGTFSTTAADFLTSQSFNKGTILNAGASQLFINPSGGNGTVVSLGAITRNSGATVNFNQPAGTISASNGFRTITSNKTGGILGGWAVVGGYDWAVNDGTNIVGLPAASYTTTSVAGTTAAHYNNLNIEVDNSAGLPDDIISPNTLRFSTAAANTLTLAPGDNTIHSGGILITGTVGGNLSTITGGTLRGAAGGELIIFQNNPDGGLAIGSVIADNTTAAGLLKSGPGTLILSGSNTYTGPTHLSGGILSVGTAGNLGSAVSALIFDGGILQVTGTGLTHLSGLGRPVSFVTDREVGIDVADPSNTFTVDQVLNQARGGFTKLGPGRAILNQANTYTGVTTVTDGTLFLPANRTVVPLMGSETGLGMDVGGRNAVLNLSGDQPMGASLCRIGNGNGAGTVNQTAGTVSFTMTGGDSLAVGAVSTGGDGTYNLSGGTLKMDTLLDRGILLGTSGPPTGAPTGTFNLSGTGSLIQTGTAYLQIGRSTNPSPGSIGPGIFNQTGGNASIRRLRMGGRGPANETASRAELNLSAGTFTVDSFSVLSRGIGSSSVINISGTADVTLPSFPTARGAGASAVITFDGGTLKSVAPSATFMGDLTNAFIKAGGAAFDTTNGSIIVTQALLTDPDSLGGGLTKAGPNTLTLTGINTWSGHTTVTGGTLSLAYPNANNNLSSVTLSPTGAMLQLGFTGSDIVDKLFIGSIQKPAGLYGHSMSGANNAGLGVGAMDTYFGAGMGTLTVNNGPAASGPYTLWKVGNANGEGPGSDWDLDGVPNGLEYFMDAPAGFTVNPALNASNTITWPNGGNLPASAYGTQFVVQISENLQTWTDVPAGNLTTNTDGAGGSLTYSLTGTGPKFVRLKVTPN